MSTAPLFRDRADAGEQLAQSILAEWRSHSVCPEESLDSTSISAQAVVYALPRGGIPIAVPIARELCCPLEIVVAKKITQPHNPELAIGSVTSDGQVLWSEYKRSRKHYPYMQAAALRKAQEKAQAQSAQLSPYCLQVNPQGAIAILVDDGIATGMTMAAAAQSLRKQEVAQIWICAPVAPKALMPRLREWGDRIIVLEAPDTFLSVSRFYREFPQVQMEEALNYLRQHNHQLVSKEHPPNVSNED